MTKRNRQTERQTDRERPMQTDRLRKIYRQKETETNRQREIETNSKAERERHRQTEKEIQRKRERERGDRFTHRKPGAETDRPKYFISKALPNAAKVISRRNTSLQITNHSLIH